MPAKLCSLRHCHFQDFLGLDGAPSRGPGPRGIRLGGEYRMAENSNFPSSSSYRLSTQDATFIYGESQSGPLHIGSMLAGRGRDVRSARRAAISFSLMVSLRGCALRNLNLLRPSVRSRRSRRGRRRRLNMSNVPCHGAGHSVTSTNSISTLARIKQSPAKDTTGQKKACSQQHALRVTAIFGVSCRARV